MELVKTKERPILFNGEMVRAVLDGRKTQTRRICKRQDVDYSLFTQEQQNYLCPYGAPGDQLWVRESWQASPWDKYGFGGWYQDVPKALRRRQVFQHTLYRADGSEYHVDPIDGLTRLEDRDVETYSGLIWKPSIHMPRWASRIQLEITDVRVERVQDISERDMVAEGIALKDSDYAWEIRDRFSQEAFFGFDIQQRWINLWDSINEKRGFGWDANPWVWVVEFGRVK